MTSRVAYGVRLDSEISLPELPVASGGELACVQVALDHSGPAPQLQPPARTSKFPSMADRCRFP